MIKTLVTVEAVLFAVMVLSVFGHKLNVLPFKVAFGGFALCLLGLLIVALAALYPLIAGPARLAAVTVIAVGLLPLVGIFAGLGPQKLKAPRIHDISTIPDAEITFEKAPELRKPSENSLEPPTDEEVRLQKNYYDGLTTLKTPMAPEDAYQKALSVARDLGWDVIHEVPAKGHFEAVEETALFGFKDDIAVRISPDGDGSHVDLRSVSRVGIGDLGANAERIKRFQKRFKE